MNTQERIEEIIKDIQPMNVELLKLQLESLVIQAQIEQLESKK